MGLLDDAIREHLELKRLRGADPGEVAREQREALTEAPVGDGSAEHRQAAGEEEEVVVVEDLLWAQPAEEEPRAEANGHEDAGRRTAQPARAPMRAPSVHGGDAGQETAELDMSALLEQEAENEAVAGSVNRPITGGDRRHEDEDMDASSLEWEVPGDDPPARELDERHSVEMDG